MRLVLLVVAAVLGIAVTEPASADIVTVKFEGAFDRVYGFDSTTAAPGLGYEGEFVFDARSPTNRDRGGVEANLLSGFLNIPSLGMQFSLDNLARIGLLNDQFGDDAVFIGGRIAAGLGSLFSFEARDYDGAAFGPNRLEEPMPLMALTPLFAEDQLRSVFDLIVLSVFFQLDGVVGGCPTDSVCSLSDSSNFSISSLDVIETPVPAAAVLFITAIIMGAGARSWR